MECIAELGFQRTTGTEIARRAGVTWGAVQHHFGDKNGILAAVLEASFQRFAETLGQPSSPDSPLAERVSEFVAKAWQHFGGPHYRTTFEILLNLPPEMESSWAPGMLGTWQEIWREYFPESPLSERDTADLMRYAVSVLSGLATTHILEGSRSRAAGRALSRLEDTLIRELSPGHGHVRKAASR